MDCPASLIRQNFYIISFTSKEIQQHVPQPEGDIRNYVKDVPLSNEVTRTLVNDVPSSEDELPGLQNLIKV